MVLKAIFHSSLAFMRTRLYALLRPSLVNMVAPCSCSMAAGTSGIGCGYFTVISLNPLESIQGHKLPPFFSMKKNPADAGDVDLLIRPCASASRTYSSIASVSVQDKE